MTAKSNVFKVSVVTLLLAGLALTVTAAGTYREVLAAGQKKLQAKDYAGAQDGAREAQQLAASPAEQSEALLLLARATAAANDAPGALAEYRRLATLNAAPTAAKLTARQAAAKLLADEKKWEEARGELGTALAIPDLGEALKAGVMLEIARLFSAEGNQAAARAEYTKLAAMPAITNNANALLGAGRTYEAEKNWPAARGEYEKVLKREGLPEKIQFQTWARIAETYSREQDLANLERTTAQALALDGPANEKAGLLFKLGDLAADCNAPEKSWEAYNKIMALPGIGVEQKTQAALRIAHAHAEEGTVPPGRNSCDPFGLPRASQQVIFEREMAGYLAANPEAKFALGVETPVRKIFRDKLWFRGAFTNRVALSAARNEYEAFQLCVIPPNVANPEAIAGVQLTATDLAGENGAKIPAAHIKIWRVDYVQTRPPSYPTCHVGYWPDPLLEPDRPATVPGHQLQPFWVRVRVAEDTPPGLYRGSIKVATEAQGVQNLALELRVRPFTLPPDSKLIFQANYYVNAQLCMNYYKLDEPAAQKMVDHYTDILVDEYKLFPTGEGYDPADKDFTKFDAQMARLVKKGIKLYNCMPRVKIEGISGGVEPEEFKRFADHLRQKGWLAVAYAYGYDDEPSEEEYPKMRDYTAKRKELVPDLKVLTSESPHPGLAGFTDAWWSDVSTEDPAYNRERQKAGDLVLWYFCRIPFQVDRIYNSMWDAPQMLIDRAAVEQRVVFWMAWKQKIDGIMVYGGANWNKKGKTTWPDEPWDPYHLHTWAYGGTDNGNGWLCYPGKQGPLPSVRLEVLREGREDYEYLWLLNSLAGNNPPEDVRQALAVNPLVCVTPHMFTRDPAAFYQERERIADLIERCQPKETK